MLDRINKEMETLAVGMAFHRNLGPVEIDAACAALQSLNPDSATVYVKHDHELKEVTRALLVSVDSAEAIAAEMKVLKWERVEPPIWWDAIGKSVIADGVLGSMRAHMVRGHIEPGRVVNNAHVIGEDDWPNALYGASRSHLSR